jgi:hypothetical protein
MPAPQEGWMTSSRAVTTVPSMTPRLDRRTNPIAAALVPKMMPIARSCDVLCLAVIGCQDMPPRGAQA